MKQNFKKSIVVDFDDTLSFTTDRDFKNATPNTPLIDKLNGLYNKGWNIRIFTARGNLSCDSRAEAIFIHKGIMEDWLEKHNVKYHELSFQKPLAEYYIDDKAITPEDFIKKEIK